MEPANLQGNFQEISQMSHDSCLAAAETSQSLKMQHSRKKVQREKNRGRAGFALSIYPAL